MSVDGDELYDRMHKRDFGRPHESGDTAAGDPADETSTRSHGSLVGLDGDELYDRLHPNGGDGVQAW
jgi:hypothetical protein